MRAHVDVSTSIAHDIARARVSPPPGARVNFFPILSRRVRRTTTRARPSNDARIDAASCPRAPAAGNDDVIVARPVHARASRGLARARDGGVKTSRMAVDAARALRDRALPMEARFTALFRLRSLGDDRSVDALLDALDASVEPSALLRHECAFALGQMRAGRAIERLIEVMEDEGEDGMVRHECAEALGAMARSESRAIDALTRACGSSTREVSETASLALRKLKSGSVDTGSTVGSAKERASANERVVDGDDESGATPYLSVDPVPAIAASTPMETLERVVLDDTEDMYARYGAMFALRNASYASASSSDACADVLGRVLATSESALLKHEVCYVLGQLQSASPGARDALVRCLEDAREHPMVRHEAAEALGSIAHPSTKDYLETFAKDSEPIIAESCEVALSIMRAEQDNVFIGVDGTVTVIGT